MPITPSTWLANLPVTAGQLSQDLYTYDGSYFSANGVMFHANRPTCHEVYVERTAVGSSVNGQWVGFGGVVGEAMAMVDTSALFGNGCDQPGAVAKYRSAGVTAPGSSGAVGVRGGWVLMINSTGVDNFTSSPSAIGAGWFLGGSQQQDVGTIQVGSTVKHNCAIAIDLINVLPAATSANTYYQPASLLSDPASKTMTVQANTAPNTWGESPRFTQIWCGISAGGTTVASVPTTLPSFTSTTPITSTLMTTAVKNPLNLLNYPPMVNAQQKFSTSIPNNAATLVPFSASTIVDSYSGFNNTTHTYTVPLPGVYFVHANVVFAAALASGDCAAGLTVTPNGSAATSQWGGNYATTSSQKVNNACAITRVLDLGAGDKVAAFAYQNSGSTSSLGSTYPAHFIMIWMGAIAPPSTAYTYTPPDVHGQLMHAGYPPGTGAGQLVSLFNAKIANDLNFLINRPYLMAFQATSQTGLSVNTFHTMVMDTLGGTIHGSGQYDGDNYNGWTSGTSNHYAAPVAGWYLVTCEVSITPSVAGNIVAGISNPTSGGIANGASQTTDWYQNLPSVTSPGPSAPLACGLYYLLVGETVAPMVQWQPNSGTTAVSTDVTSFKPSFSVLWICE